MEPHTPQSKGKVAGRSEKRRGHRSSSKADPGGQVVDEKVQVQSVNLKERKQHRVLEKRATAAGEADQQTQHQSKDTPVRKGIGTETEGQAPAHIQASTSRANNYVHGSSALSTPPPTPDPNQSTKTHADLCGRTRPP